MVGEIGKWNDILKNLPCEIKGLSSSVRQLNFVTYSSPPNPSNIKGGCVLNHIWI